jgi:hypothetical protein
MSDKLNISTQGLKTQPLQNIIQLGSQISQQTFYQKTLTRENPTAFVLLLDQSGSMDEGEFLINGQEMTKAEALAHYVNVFLDELINKSTRDDGLRNYMDICIIGYCEDDTAEYAWIDNLKNKSWVKIAELNENCTKSETQVESIGRGGVVQSKTIISKSWIEPIADGRTPMGSALTKTYDLLDQWIRKGNNKTSFPPTVINFTDGMATDAENEELIQLASKIKALHTEDGNVLLYNCHLTSLSTEAVLFPQSKTELPNDKYAHTLLEMSSIIPPQFNLNIADLRKDADTFSKYHGMIYNSGVSAIASLLKLGTTQAK